MFNATTRILNVGSGNTAIDVQRGANIPSSAMTNSAGNELRLEPYLLARSAGSVAGPADTAENIVATITVPKIGPNGMIRLSCQVSCTNNANAKTFRVRLGGIGGTIHAEVALASTTGGTFVTTIRNQNSVSAQKAFMHGATNVGVIKVWGETSNTQDTDAAPTLVVTLLKATGGDTFTLENFTAEVFPSI